jgi:hypothetical protein
MRWFLVILIIPYFSNAQIKKQSIISRKEDTLVVPSIPSDVPHSALIEIFQKVEQGLQTNTVDKFAKDIGKMISITITSGESGYYSVNQATSVLAGYFAERRPISFEFSSMNEKCSSPYATGRFVFVQKGIQRSAQVYVSLTQQDSLWVISKFNIY